ncbi:unnamed protein product [Adineta ricciae]|uniref:Uncharacterized protein n=1 Tax=Adineta ricciae TaxID=249248 RepID=A0A813RY52_ADIRI|nr:unnamed protein product [Adineta ricciae]
MLRNCIYLYRQEQTMFNRTTIFSFYFRITRLIFVALLLKSVITTTTSGERKMADEDNKLDFIPGPIILILGSVYTLIVLCILLIIPILQLAFGGAYLGQCPVEQNIPIYLIVTGACGLASILLTIMIVLAFILLIKRQTAGTAVTAACIIACVLIFLFVMSLFLFAWFIAGNVWIFGVHKKVDLDDASSPNYCQPVAVHVFVLVFKQNQRSNKNPNQLHKHKPYVFTLVLIIMLPGSVTLKET